MTHLRFIEKEWGNDKLKVLIQSLMRKIETETEFLTKIRVSANHHDVGEFSRIFSCSLLSLSE